MSTIIVKSKTSTPVATEVLAQNGFKINGNIFSDDFTITKGQNQYKFSHPIWSGKNVRIELVK